jgi:uncharacterized protein (DUF4415 family)
MTDGQTNAPREGGRAAAERRMAQRRGADRQVAGRSMGRKLPNLVIVYDSEKGSEFRVQCEMGLPDEAEAARLKEDMLTGTPAALKRVKEHVMARIDSDATDAFRQLVSEAFDENIRVRAAPPRR